MNAIFFSSARQDFPEDAIPAEKKDREWCLKFVKAAWWEWMSSGYDCMNRGNLARLVDGSNETMLPLYDEISAYMEGRQNPVQYLPMMGVDKNVDDSWMHIDTTILPIMPMLVRIVTGILDKSDYDIGFFPNDTLATDRKNSYFANLKARMAMREEIEAQFGQEAPNIIRQLGLERGANEPADSDELEMQAMYTYKDLVATQWSSAVKAILSANRGSEIRKINRMDTLYYGVAGTKDYIDTNGALRCRAVRAVNMMSSYCEKNDFSDARYLGEVLSMTMQDFAQSNQELSRTELMDVARKFCGKFGNPNSVSSWDAARNFRLHVLDIEWPSTHLFTYEQGTDKYGNMRVVRQDNYRSGNNFIRQRRTMMYGAKWIIDSDIIWDDGLCTNMKRAKGQLSEVEPNFHFYAPMKTGMRIQSIGQMVKPICDQAQWAWLKLQKTTGEYRSKGISIDFTGTEGIALGKAGADLTPAGVVELILQGNIFAWRSKDVHSPGANVNKQPPVMVVEGTGMDDIIQWMSAVQQYVQMLKSMIVGLNDYTDASTPDARSLGATVNTAVMSTNNSLNDIVETDVHLLGRLSEGIVIRIQDMVQFGLIDNLAPAIGDNSVQFFKDNPAATPADWNIEIRPLPTEQERQQVLTEAKNFVGAGFLEYEDIVTIMSTNDLREAQQLLGWKIKKRKEEKIKESLMLQEQNGKVQTDGAIAVEKERQATVELENKGKIEVANIQADAAIEVAKINAGASTTGKAMALSATMEQKAEAA